MNVVGKAAVFKEPKINVRCDVLLPRELAGIVIDVGNVQGTESVPAGQFAGIASSTELLHALTPSGVSVCKAQIAALPNDVAVMLEFTAVTGAMAEPGVGNGGNAFEPPGCCCANMVATTRNELNIFLVIFYLW